MNVINNIRSMAVRYIPDNLITDISNLKWDIQDFIKVAIEEKLEREKHEAKKYKWLLYQKQ